MNRVWIRFAVVFAVGLILGTALGRWGGMNNRRNAFKSPEKRTEFLVKKLTKRLDLRPEQQEKVRGVLEKKRQEMDKFHEDWKPRMEAAWAEARKEMQTILDPDQWEKFLKLEEKRKKRRENRRPSPPDSR